MRCSLLTLIFVAGCSTHPLVDLCDYFKPGHMYPDKCPPYGGVAVQAGGIQGTPPSATAPPAIPPPVPPAVPSTPAGPPVSVPTFPTAPPSMPPFPG